MNMYNVEEIAFKNPDEHIVIIMYVYACSIKVQLQCMAFMALLFVSWLYTKLEMALFFKVNYPEQVNTFIVKSLLSEKLLKGNKIMSMLTYSKYKHDTTQ